MNLNFALTHLDLGEVYLQKGLLEEGLAEFLEAGTLSGLQPEAMADLGYAYGVLGKQIEAQKVLADLKRTATRRYVSPALAAIAYVGLGDKTQGLAWLERAYQDRSLGTFHKMNYPELDPLRSDPGFQDLQRRMGFPQ